MDSTSSKHGLPADINQRIEKAFDEIAGRIGLQLGVMAEDFSKLDPDTSVIRVAFVQALASLAAEFSVRLNFPVDLFYKFLSAELVKYVNIVLKQQDQGELDKLMSELIKNPVGSA